jgi:hypothetical protein
MQRENLKKKNTRGITKHPYFTEGKSYLTRKIKVD